MTRELLSLDFYGNELIAALAVLDEETDTLRLRHALRKPCKSFCGALVRDMDGATRELTAVLDEIGSYASNSVSVVIGLRGKFLSFKRSSGFESVSSRNRIIGTRDIEAALHNSIPTHLSDTLEVIDVFPQSYTVDGNIGITNPRGMSGCTLEVETFLSLALATHLKTFTTVLSNCGCNEFQILPSIIAAGDMLLNEDEKQNGALLLDIGQTHTSALMYHKGTLVEAWELDFGKDRMAQAVADLLQNDLETAKEVLKTYEPGTDEIVDEVLEEAQTKLLYAIKKELLQSLIYLQHPSGQLVLCGVLADKAALKSCKKIFGVRKTRLATATDLVTDCGNAADAAYSGSLALVAHAIARERQALGVTQAKPSGLLDGLLTKLGLDEIF
ncbi:MAG: hypothetical protein IKP96_02300 [Elusimicrobiaceae bacterium]|nr:hypothetical protein [Elusimicrobiaceae bacterium]